MRGVRTKVSLNTNSSHSMKSTIPEGVAEALKLNPGDSVDWSLVILEEKMVAVVKKA